MNNRIVLIYFLFFYLSRIISSYDQYNIQSHFLSNDNFEIYANVTFIVDNVRLPVYICITGIHIPIHNYRDSDHNIYAVYNTNNKEPYGFNNKRFVLKIIILDAIITVKSIQFQVLRK